MLTLNLDDDDVQETSRSKVVFVLRIALVCLLIVSAIAGAAFGGFYYAKYQTTEKKLDELIAQINNVASDVNDMQSDIGSIKRNMGGSSEIGDISGKLDKMQSDIDSIASDVSSMESDISSIQLKIGY